MGLLFIIPMFLIMYMLLIRPQQKRVREQQALQRAVEVGDEVITTSGIYGIITAMEDEDMWIEVADGVEIRMARGAVARGRVRTRPIRPSRTYRRRRPTRPMKSEPRPDDGEN